MASGWHTRQRIIAELGPSTWRVGRAPEYVMFSLAAMFGSLTSERHNCSISPAARTTISCRRGRQTGANWHFFPIETEVARRNYGFGTRPEGKLENSRT